MPPKPEDIEKSRQFLAQLQEFDAARKRAKDEQDEKLKKKAMEESEEALKKLNASGKKLEADDLSGLSPNAVTSAVNSANDLAHANYRKETDANNALYDKAQEAYDKTCADCNAEIDKASQANSENPSQENYDQYLRVKAQQEELIDKAYIKLNQELDATNAANDKAHARYAQQINENHAALDKFVAARAAADEQAKLQGSAPSPKATVVSEQYKKVLEDLNKKFQDDPWYKANPPQEKDGKLNIAFKNTQDMTNFFREQAAKNQNFILVDGATQKVMGYSKDGQFYHANNKLVKDGDTFAPGDKTIDQFKIPTSKAKAGKDEDVSLSHPPDAPSVGRAAESLRETASKLSTPTPTPNPGDGHSVVDEETRDDAMALK